MHRWTCQMMKFHEKVRFLSPEGFQKCKIALLTQSWSSYGLPNVIRRDGSTSWRVIFLCQWACCVASEPQTMCKFRTGKLRFLMDSQFFIRWSIFPPAIEVVFRCMQSLSSIHAVGKSLNCSKVLQHAQVDVSDDEIS